MEFELKLEKAEGGKTTERYVEVESIEELADYMMNQIEDGWLIRSLVNLEGMPYKRYLLTVRWDLYNNNKKGNYAKVCLGRCPAEAKEELYRLSGRIFELYADSSVEEVK